ncbi:MAG: hypothetical protein CSA65_07855 [Proteobacteria bacterium]|nr:MAG: hypothetical protein CSA65_07855 [Pseudomonadota bacterium]
MPSSTTSVFTAAMAKRGGCRYAADTMDVFTHRPTALATLLLIAALSLAGCPKDGKGKTKAGASQAVAKLPGQDNTPRKAKSNKAPTGKPAKPGTVDEPAATPKPPTSPKPVKAAGGGGHDFIAEARLLFQVAACPKTTTPKVAGFAPHVVKVHCQRLRKQMARYRKNYVDKAKPWLAERQPKTLPTTVVYPFGGGDLLSALTTYSQAREITTISLEHTGDVRGVKKLRGRKLAENLKLLRQTIAGLLALDDSTSVNMMKMQRTPIPGQLAFFLVALSVYDYEPISLRYFRIEANGTLHYFTKAEFEAHEGRRAKRLSGGWVTPTWSVAFSHAELRFRRQGKPDAPVLVHRHIAANLADSKLPQSGPLLTHLRSKGPFVAMTKAAAYMIWRRGFSHIRDLLLDKMVYMVSDSTGIPPNDSKARGFRVTTYGRYRQCFFEKRFAPKTDEQFIRLWRQQRYRKLPFRYGYPDREGSWHMMITHKP